MHCDLSGFGSTHSYCSQLVGEVASRERMALLGFQVLSLVCQLETRMKLSFARVLSPRI